MSQTDTEKVENQTVGEPAEQAAAPEDTEMKAPVEEPKEEDKQPESEKQEIREERVVTPPPPAPAPVIPEKPKKHWGFRILLVVIAAIIIIAAAGVLTFSFVPTGPAHSTSFTHQNNLNILIPNAVPVNILGSTFTVTQLGDGAVIAIDGKGGQNLANGESRDLVQGHGFLKMYGRNFIETDYSINLTYRGLLNGKHNFLMTIKSTAYIPQFIIPLLLPKGVTVL